MATKKSPQSPRTQLVLALGLAGLLIVVLAYKTGKFRPQSLFSSDPAEESQMLATVSVEEFMSLIQKATVVSEFNGLEPTTVSMIERNPFLKPMERSGSHSEQTITVTRPAPEFEIVTLRLSATLVAGENSQALINGQYVAEGGKIEGYRVISIGERKVIVEQDDGPVTLYMSGE